MEIDKDKVVEAAKAYVEAAQEYIKQTGASHAVLKEYIALKEALNPPPPRPSKEECLDWLATYFQIGGVTQDFSTKVTATIEYLKEPNLKRVKNTGVAPECKTFVACWCGGAFDVLDKPEHRYWGLDGRGEGIIAEYIILE